MKHFTVNTFFLFFLSSITICSAQIDSFKLDQVHNPDFKRKVLEFDILFDHSFRNSFEGVNSTGTDKNYGLRGNFAPRYRAVRNTDSYQGMQSINMNIIGSSASETNTNGGILLHESNETHYGIDYSSANRFYLSESMVKHLVVNPSLETNYSLSKGFEDRNSLEINRRYERTQISASSDLGIGHGRLENISDARIVLFILEELKDKRLLNRTPTKEDINALADLAIYVKNQRFFDARIKRIYELTAMDSLIKDLGLSSGNSIEYHTVLQDNWNYAIKPFRQTGRLIQFGINPEYQKLWNNEAEDRLDTFLDIRTYTNNTDQWEYLKLNAFFTYGKYHPISASLQNNFIFRAESGVMNNWNRSPNNPVIREGNLFYSLSLRNQFEIYPTSRTYFEFSTSVEYINASDYYTPSMSSNQVYTGAFLNTYYYISPQLRLSASCSTSYSYFNTKVDINPTGTNTIEELNDFNTAVKLQLTYKIL